MPSEIKRIGRSARSRTRSRSIVHNGILTTVAVSPNGEPTLYEQAQSAFAVLDLNLAEAGTDKSRVLMVNIFVTNVANKPELDRAWDAWIDPANPPLRACVGVELEGRDLVEMVVTAAVD